MKKVVLLTTLLVLLVSSAYAGECVVICDTVMFKSVKVFLDIMDRAKAGMEVTPATLRKCITDGSAVMILKGTKVEELKILDNEKQLLSNVGIIVVKIGDNKLIAIKENISCR